MALVLVTGFLGAHIVNGLLTAGHRVRGIARAGKLALVREGYSDSPSKDQVEVVEVSNIAHDNVTEHLKGMIVRSNSRLLRSFSSPGVDAPIHTASPLIKGAPEEAIAERATLNFMRQAEKAGIKTSQ